MAGGRGRRGSRRPAGDVQGLGPGCRRPAEGRGPSRLVVTRRGVAPVGEVLGQGRRPERRRGQGRAQMHRRSWSGDAGWRS